MVDDQFLDEHHFSISLLSPWIFGITNVLDASQFFPHLYSEGKTNIFRNISPYTWIGGSLFKLGPYLIMRRCVNGYEVYDILLTFHDGPCGGFFLLTGLPTKYLQQSIIFLPFI